MQIITMVDGCGCSSGGGDDNTLVGLFVRVPVLPGSIDCCQQVAAAVAIVWYSPVHGYYRQMA